MTYAAYVLRTSKADGISYGGFKWPKSGHVEAPNWRPIKECGGGLHGLLWGRGDVGLLNWSPDAIWQVIGLTAGELAQTLEFGGKCKFPSGDVVFSGAMRGAVTFLADHGGSDHGFFVADDGRSKVVAGGDSVVFAFGNSTAVCSDNSTAVCYDSSTVRCYDRSTAWCYDRSTAWCYDNPIAKCFDNSTAECYGDSTARCFDSSRARCYGDSTVRCYGSSTAWCYGSSTAECYNSSTAECYNSSTVNIYGMKSLEVHDQAVAIDRRVAGKVRCILAGDEL